MNHRFCSHLGYVVPVLLLTVAVGQMILARAGGLSAWKGGGFGMFSTSTIPRGERSGPG